LGNASKIWKIAKGRKTVTHKVIFDTRARGEKVLGPPQWWKILNICVPPSYAGKERSEDKRGKKDE
jgi:hypothetical protein